MPTELSPSVEALIRQPRFSSRIRELLVGGITAAAALLGILSAIAPVSGFTLTHYLFTYSDGFLRRALVGSVIAAAGIGPVPEGLPARIGFGYLVLLVVLVSMLVVRGWRHGDRTSVLLLATLFVGASQLQVLAFDVGKFDGLLLALTASAALVTVGGGRSAAMSVAAIGVIGVLVHELHLLAGVPLATAMVALGGGRGGPSRKRSVALAAVPASLVGLVLAVLAGDPPGGSLASAEARMAARAAFPIGESATFVQDLGLMDTVRMTFDVLAARPTSMVVSVLVAVPSAAAAMLLLLGGRSARTNGGDGLQDAGGRRPQVILAAASLSPLAILPLGFDWYRWVTIAVVNLIIAALWWQASPRRASKEWAGATAPPGLGLFVLVALSLVLASVSVTAAIENLRLVLG